MSEKEDLSCFAMTPPSSDTDSGVTERDLKIAAAIKADRNYAELADRLPFVAASICELGSYFAAFLIQVGRLDFQPSVGLPRVIYNLTRAARGDNAAAFAKYYFAARKCRIVSDSLNPLHDFLTMLDSRKCLRVLLKYDSM